MKYEALFLSYDWKERLPAGLVAQAVEGMPNSITFRVGNETVDNYVRVVTNCPELRTLLRKNEPLAHKMATLQPNPVRFSDLAKLVKRAERIGL